jgi:hypothetical protein
VFAVKQFLIKRPDSALEHIGQPEFLRRIKFLGGREFNLQQPPAQVDLEQIGAVVLVISGGS